MPLTDYHDMVQTFASNRANHALGIGVLPRRSWRCDRLPDVQHPGLARKSFAIDLVPIPDQIPRAVLRPARLDHLSPRPLCGRMLRDIERPQPAPPVAQHHPHEQHSKGRGPLAVGAAGAPSTPRLVVGVRGSPAPTPAECESWTPVS